MSPRKRFLTYLPYLLMGLYATNFGEAWRMAVGEDASAKLLSLISVFPAALKSFWPSLHPFDLLVGLCSGAGLWLAVYLKRKSARKYRHGIEYGSAPWPAEPRSKRKVLLQYPKVNFHLPAELRSKTKILSPSSKNNRAFLFSQRNLSLHKKLSARTHMRPGRFDR